MISKDSSLIVYFPIITVNPKHPLKSMLTFDFVCVSVAMVMIVKKAWKLDLAVPMPARKGKTHHGHLGEGVVGHFDLSVFAFASRTKSSPFHPVYFWKQKRTFDSSFLCAMVRRALEAGEWL